MAESYQPSLLASPNAQFALELSRRRLGRTRPVLRVGACLRVAYDWEDGDDLLVRFYWPVMDRTFATPPIRTELLSGVSNVELRFLDSTGIWHLDWPPLSTDPAAAFVARPRAIDFAVEVEGFGRLSRLVETSQ